VTVTAPARGPGAVGVKVTAMAQLAPLASVAVQLLVWAKSPLARMLAIVKVAPPVLVRTAVWVALVVPII